MQVECRDSGDATVVMARGSIGEMEADLLFKKFAEAFARNRHKIILDLTDVDLITSTGIGVIMTVYKTTRSHGGYIRIVNPQPLIRDVFVTTKLVKIIPICATLEEAQQQA
ncbi:MAG: STAS domain-containing protein [Planctomycetes bacterium]|nr:STAS domain-containing protein [Planctomycetota bacterium]MBM4078431.1 STAS domain-containing protein [Planctomycetota bacterium]MBM4083344.1 STAS domain-containing protein [Planctomycetota bacterium]